MWKSGKAKKLKRITEDGNMCKQKVDYFKEDKKLIEEEISKISKQFVITKKKLSQSMQN